jgi:tetratricopeptide (TPR) repeat protein
MSPERWPQVEQLFHDALDVRAAERAAFLARACEGDDELRREVEALLAYEQEAEGFIAEPIMKVAAERLAEHESRPRSLVGGKLGGYQILELIGRGGMGEVYLARDLKLGREVAVKLLPAEFARDAARLAYFEREARMLSALRHENIATIHALEESGGEHFIVLEYVPGETLAERLKSGALPVKEALPILQQIADALSAAHAKGIVHRDLKPANIKITPQGRVKVLDFGLAKVSRHDAVTAEMSGASITARTLTATLTGEGLILGTVPYMSPEQTRGQAVDRRTDVWAFGCVCYETLAGARAFDGATTADTLAAIISREPDWRALPKQTPHAVESLIRRCLQKDYFLRLPDAGSAKRTIEQAVTDYSPLAARLRRARWNARLALAAAALVILVASFVTWQVIERRSRPEDLAAMLALRMKGDNLTWALTRLAPQTVSAAGGDQDEMNLDEVGNQRAIEETIAALKTRAASERQSARLHAMLSQAYFLKYSITLDNADKDEAVRACELALRLDGESPQVQSMLGSLFIALGEYDKAADRFKTVLARESGDFDATLGLARAHEGKGQPAEAERFYRQAAALRPDYWGGHNELGGFYYAGGRYEDAAREWERVTILAPLNPAGFTNLGAAYRAMGQAERAEEAYRRSIAVRATVAGRVGLGTIFFERGDYAKAEAEFEAAAKQAPTRPEAWGNLGDARRALNRADAAAAYDKAIELARRRLETDPNDATYASMLAEWLAKRGEKQEAVAQIERALKEPCPGCLGSAVVVYHLAGRRRDALRTLQEALESGYFFAREFDANLELAGLRSDPEYKRIAQPHRGNN